MLTEIPQRQETLTLHILDLENELLNIQYLLTRHDVTEEQSKRLRSLLKATEAELINVYDVI